MVSAVLDWTACRNVTACGWKLVRTSQTNIHQQCLVGTAGFALGQEDGRDDLLMSLPTPMFSVYA